MNFKPIGKVVSPHKSLSGIPIQPCFAEGIQGQIIIDPIYQDGLKDLDGFSHIIVIFHLHKSSGFKLRIVPYLDNTEHGLFATRAPKRPNPIGLSVVRLIKVEENILTIENVDMLDGTPVLDIKPYIPDFEVDESVKKGWYNQKAKKGGISDKRFCD